MRKHIELLGYTYISNGIDTPEEIFDYAYDHGISTVAIADIHSVQAFPRAWQAAKHYNIKVLFGAVFLIQLPYGTQTIEYEQICYAKNNKGIESLYHFINAVDNGCLPVETLIKHQENLILGTILYVGDAYARNFFKVSHAVRQDFCLINALLWHDLDCVRTIRNIQKTGCKICASVLSSDYPNDKNAFWFAKLQQSDKEWVEEFEFLGEDLLKQVIFDNPISIADLVEEVDPLPPIRCKFDQTNEEYLFQNLYLKAIWKDMKKNTNEIQYILEDLYPEFRFLKAGYICTETEQKEAEAAEISYCEEYEEPLSHTKTGIQIMQGLFVPIPRDLVFPQEIIDEQWVTHFDYHDLQTLGYEIWPRIQDFV